MAAASHSPCAPKRASGRAARWAPLDLRFQAARLIVENAALWPLVVEGRLQVENLPGVGVDGSPWRAPTEVELGRRERAKAACGKPPGGPERVASRSAVVPRPTDHDG